MLIAPNSVSVRWLLVPEDRQWDTLCFTLLSAEEQHRAAAFLREEPRREFVLSRAALRLLLSAATACQPQSVPITLGRKGKPETPGIYFNLSHAHGTIAFAFSIDTPVGIDVEANNPAIEHEAIARQAFSEADLQRMENLDEKQRMLFFFDLWTRREAMAKCLGDGIIDPAALRGELPTHGLRAEALSLQHGVSAAVAFESTASLANTERIFIDQLLCLYI